MKTYTAVFGTGGDPRGYTGLAPTFLLFYNLATGTTNTPPSISELIAGKTGVYKFQYGVTQPIAFILDGATSSLGSGRYVSGQLDPVDRVDEVLGTFADSFGDSSNDPTSVAGFLKRAQEWNEGDSVYTKSTGALSVWNRTSSGTTTLLGNKTITDSSTQTTKT